MVGPALAPSPAGGVALENANPLIYRRQGERPVTAREEDDELPDAIDDREIFDILGKGAGGPGETQLRRPVELPGTGLPYRIVVREEMEAPKALWASSFHQGKTPALAEWIWKIQLIASCLLTRTKSSLVVEYFALTFFVLHLIRSINDPEHPLTLEELNVVEQVRVKVNDAESTVSVEFTPTIPHCSMATLIGLSIKVKLIRSLPERFKVDVHITPGTHASEHAVNKQLADKERVAAALENAHLLEVVNQCLSGRP
ncbi:UNVERIFIED_CONTAM: hypothetical protein K2H54_025964 [Gekko kuhli]